MKLRLLYFCLFAVCGCWIAGSPTLLAQTKAVEVIEDNAPGRRLALVIGNQNYPKAPLKNSLHDAVAIRKALEEVGFAVDYREDALLRELGQSIDTFTKKLRPNDVALFYFSGHGVQIEGKNYLIPLDFAAESEADVVYVAYAADRVQRKMEERGTRLNILILDACRDNPYRFGRSLGGGLAPMAEGVGTLIAFAAKEGQVASDNPTGEESGKIRLWEIK